MTSNDPASVPVCEVCGCRVPTINHSPCDDCCEAPTRLSDADLYQIADEVDAEFGEFD